jgi:hypothetical protein
MVIMTQEQYSDPFTTDSRYPGGWFHGNAGTESAVRGAVNRATPFRIVHLRETAPVELSEGARHLLARERHPGAGICMGMIHPINGACPPPRERVRS